MNELHKMDRLRTSLASVYRSFKDIDEFMHELEDLINSANSPSANRGEKKGDSRSESAMGQSGERRTLHA